MGIRTWSSSLSSPLSSTLVDVTAGGCSVAFSAGNEGNTHPSELGSSGAGGGGVVIVVFVIGLLLFYVLFELDNTRIFIQIVLKNTSRHEHRSNMYNRLFIAFPFDGLAAPVMS